VTASDSLVAALLRLRLQFPCWGKDKLAILLRRQRRLNGVGAKLSRAQITQIVKDGKANTTMPALPSGTTDQQLNELVDFLASLKYREGGVLMFELGHCQRGPR
jgi:hypothetical protein